MEDEVMEHRDRRALPGKFRVLAWQRAPERKSWLKDFDTRQEALAYAKETARRRETPDQPDPVIACAYDSQGKRLIYAPAPEAQPDFRFPTSVTKLAGLSTPCKSGTYRRNR